MLFTHTERPFFNFDVNLDPDSPGMEEFKYCQPSQLYHSSLQIRNQQQHQTQHLIQQLGLPAQLQGSGQYNNSFATGNLSSNKSNSNNNLGWNPGGNSNIMPNRRSDENLNECVIQNSNNSNNNVNINYSNQNNSLTNTTSNTTNTNTNSANNPNTDNRNGYQGMNKSSNLITNADGSTLVSLVPAKININSTMQNSSSPPISTNLNTMLQQVVPSNGHMLLSPSKPSNISELSNSSMVSSSSNNSTLDSNSGTTTSIKRTKKSLDTSFSKNDPKDGKYFERRKRNNVAAKKSRDARKQREDEIAIRASFLEKENSILKAQLQTLKDEAQQLRMLLSQKKNNNSMPQNTGSSCSNCTNCSSSTPKNNGIVMNNSNNGYLGNPNLGNLGYDHNDLDVKSGQNQNTSSLSSASLYLQHQNQLRHPII